MENLQEIKKIIDSIENEAKELLFAQDYSITKEILLRDIAELKNILDL